MTKNSNGILEKIIDIKESLPKKQRHLCDYIIENYQSIGMMTVAELSQKANVGTSTVMRIMKHLGYESFNDMRRDMHKETINTNLSTWWHMQESFKRDTNEGLDTLSQSWSETLTVMNKTINSTLIENFHQAIDVISKAKRVNILGLRSSKAPAIYYEMLMEGFNSKTRQLSYDSDLIFDKILQFEEGEILFLITNSPYTARSMEAAKFCYDQGHPIILLTDHLSCPITPFANVLLKTEASKQQYTITPTITLIESIVIEVGRRMSGTSIEHLDKLGELLENKGITRS